MYPPYNNIPQPPRPLHHQPQFVGAGPYPPAASHALAVPYNQPPTTFDESIKTRYANSDNGVRNAISRSPLLNPEARQQCLHFVRRLRIHKHLFMHTYAHLVSCCRGRHRYLHLLVESASVWSGWDSVRQLSHHSLIRDRLVSFWADCTCHQHRFLLAQHFVITDDGSDLLCHLLYCAKKQELYVLANQSAVRVPDESEHVIELLWQFLMESQESDVLRRLRACIYRMSRKSAYLPRALHIAHPSISNRQSLVPGAKGLVTKATMDGREVVIKRIPCGDRATRNKCLELFASEAILWHTLRHKNVVPFLGVVMEGTLDMGLVSQYFRNGNIRNHMRRYSPRDWPVLARRLATDVAAGLTYIHCHEPPIIHGDLKGDNVLVDDDGHARLGDFGQSYASDSGQYLDSTRVGLAAYSPVHWMAPELMVGGDLAKVSDKSDIYSFGCVIYEMVSGKIPFEGFSFGYVVEHVTKGERPKRPESTSGSDPLWRTAKLCWEKLPEARPPTTRLVSLLA